MIIYDKKWPLIIKLISITQLCSSTTYITIPNHGSIQCTGITGIRALIQYKDDISYQYKKSHCGAKTILRPSYLHNGISYTGKTTSLYWIKALDILRQLQSVQFKPRTAFLNKLKLRQNGCHFADNILKCIFFSFRLKCLNFDYIVSAYCCILNLLELLLLLLKDALPTNVLQWLDMPF